MHQACEQPLQGAAELHGFASLIKTFFGILVALAVLTVLFAFGLALLIAVTVGVPAT